MPWMDEAVDVGLSDWEVRQSGGVYCDCRFLTAKKVVVGYAMELINSKSFSGSAHVNVQDVFVSRDRIAPEFSIDDARKRNVGSFPTFRIALDSERSQNPHQVMKFQPTGHDAGALTLEPYLRHTHVTGNQIPIHRN